jgi:signal transduction histidine kinase
VQSLFNTKPVRAALRAICVLLALVLQIGPAISNAQAKDRELIVGSEVDFPPFALGQADSEPDGFTVELWTAVAKEMGLKYEFRVRPFDELLGDFREGRIDVLINLAYSNKRAEFAEFSAPHVVSYGTFFARRGTPTFASERELYDKEIVILKGDLLHDYSRISGYNSLIPVNSIEAGMRLLAEGKHDGMLISRLAGLQSVKQLGLTSIEPIGPPIRGVVQRFGFAAGKGNSELIAVMNEGLAITRSNGTYGTIYDKWFSAIDPRPIPPVDFVKVLGPAILLIILAVAAYLYQRRLNTLLERRVQERTFALAEALEIAEVGNRAKSEFVSTVSHELRTPLTAIQGALGLIAGKALGDIPPAMEQMLEMANRNSQRLALLINDLLDMEKLASGKLQLVLRVQALMPLIEEAIGSTKEYAHRLNVSFVLDQQNNDIDVNVDGNRLQQVLINLLSNAANFSPTGGQVHVSSRVQGSTVRISVRDTGPGVPEEFRSRIFERFSQADSSDTRQKGGTGLGLAISKDLIESMGGAIGFSSEEGKGACFHIELPVLT